MDLTPTPDALTGAAAAPDAAAAQTAAPDTVPAPAADATPSAETQSPAAEEATREPMRIPATKEEALAMMEALAADDDPAAAGTDEVAFVKQQYYQFRNNELATAREEYIAAGGDPDSFAVPADPDEERFRAAYAAVRDKKAAIRAAQDAEREANLVRKQAIVDELKQMSADTDNVNRHYNKAKDLQAEFKALGEVPAPKAAAIWKAYQEAVELFYDQWKVNKELRDYDFKKNLAEKQALLDEARTLTEVEDPIAAFKRLQDLHDQWRNIGPVAKDVREEIWNAFKEASATINKRYQAHFEERKARERENEAAKTALCEQVEALDFSDIKSFNGWEKMTAAVLALQEQWRALGYLPRKASNQLFARFRAACDKFFTAKAEYYKSTRDEYNANIAKKTALCEQAEALKDSTEWRKTADVLVELQKEWKTVGPIPKRQSDALWTRFQAACDYFFEQKKANMSGTRNTERANLKAKQEILAALEALNAPDCATPRAEAVNAVRELRAQWQGIGHVPFRDKDKLQESYRTVLGELFDKLDINERPRGERRGDRRPRQEEQADGRPVNRDRERLARTLEQRRSELATYENNLGFFNSKSKSGDSLVREMERKMEQLRDEIADLRSRIAAMDAAE